MIGIKLKRGALFAAILSLAACGDRADTPAAFAPGSPLAEIGAAAAAPQAVSLTALIDTIDNTIIEDSTSAYVVPTQAQTSRFRAAVDSVLAGRVDGADQLLDSFAYDVYLIKSSVTDDTMVIFRERKGASGRVTRGWGTYVFNTSPTARRADIHVNHPISDQHTEDIGADLFQDCRCRWLFIAGAERDANHLDPLEQSDMARATNSVFHQMYLHVAAPDVRTVSVHGFVESKHSLPPGADHVLSNGRNEATAQTVFTPAEVTLRQRLKDAGFLAGLYSKTTGFDELSAFPNPQGRHSNTQFGFGRWLSLEIERNVRDSPTLWQTNNTVVSQWIIDFPT